MLRIVIGIILIIFFFLVLLEGNVEGKAEISDIILGGSIIMLLPGILLIYYGYRSRKKNQQMSKPPIRIILGLMLIIIFFIGLLGNIIDDKANIVPYLGGGGIIFLIPGILLIYFGLRSRKKNQKVIKINEPSGATLTNQKAIKINEPSFAKGGFMTEETISKEASSYINEALIIIESQVVIKPDVVVVSNSGSKGKVMEAAQKFKAAFQLHPKTALLHYAYASCLHLSAQYKSAEDEMRKCAETHPEFIPAKLALEGWGKWQSMFYLPPWGKATKTVHPALSGIILTNVLLSVRDSIVPRATIFMRDAGCDFQDINALQSARITLASVISPVRDPQVIGIYAKIYDNPNNPLDIEILQIPFTPRGDKTRAIYEYLCIQEDIDFVVIDRNDRILINKRLSIPQNMLTTNKQIFKLLEASEGSEFSESRYRNAIMEHQRKFAVSDVRY